MRQSISAQFGKPEGIVGNLIGHIMSVNNKKRTRWAIEKMKIYPDDRILEIGFGPGDAVKWISETLDGGSITGIDHSEAMYKQALKKNRGGIREGKVILLHGAIGKLTLPGNAFDKIFAINVHWFWKDPQKEYKKLYELLKDGGNLYLVFQPRWVKSEEEVNQITEDTKLRLEETGFEISEFEVKEMKPVNCMFLSSKKK